MATRLPPSVAILAACEAIKSARGYDRADKIKLLRRTKLARALLATASAGVLSVTISSWVNAQVSDCIPDPAIAMSGDTIICNPPGGFIFTPITTNVDDLTVVIGDPVSAVIVNANITMTGPNGQRLQIENPNSSVTSLDGVSVAVTGGVDDLSIVSAGDISGDSRGISARQFGTGGISIEAASVSGLNGDGIYARNDGTGITSISANIVTGGDTGIRSSAVDGDTTITPTSTAVVTGQTRTGIDARSTGVGAIAIQGSSGDIVGATDGIYSRTAGGAITAQNLDSVTSIVGDGIDASSNSGDVTITGIGTILGNGGNSIFADAGAGDISIQGVGLVGDVSGTGSGDIVIGDDITDTFFGVNGSGIVAITDGVIDIGGTTAIGDVISTNASGIFAWGGGSNTVSVTTADVTGTSGTGLAAYSSGGGVTVDSSGGTVIGGVAGVHARDSSAGTVSVTTADVTGMSGTGLAAYSSGGGITVDSTAGSVTGSFNGILAREFRAGTVSVTTADVTGMTGNGILALSYGGVTVDSTAGTVVGRYGVVASNRGGAGTVSVSTADVTGTYGGIYARSSGGGVTVDSSAGSVLGGKDGVLANDTGAGAVSVTANIVTGGDTGIRSSAVDGDTTITLTSTAVVTGQTRAGIDARSTGTMGQITVQGSSGDVVGATNGIYMRTMGANITIDNLDSVTGNAGNGIVAASIGGDISIASVDTIVGTGGIGILADAGTGNISIQGTGLVGGITGMGPAGAFDFNGMMLNGALGSGILASSDGDINIGGVTAIGDVSSTNAVGIFAHNSTAATGSVTIGSTGTISGATSGIYVGNYGTGTTTIDANNVTATSITGIFVRNGMNTTGVSLTSTGDVQAQLDGIYVANNGAGSIDITANTVTASDFVGIRAQNTGSFSSDISINALGDIIGGSQGIYAGNNGQGSNTITAGNVSGYATGIFTRNMGNGALTIRANEVSGTIGNGIIASNGRKAVFGYYRFPAVMGGTDIAISTTGHVAGGSVGIDAFNNGTGSTAINVTSVSGVLGNGIRAENLGSTVDLTIVATGAVDGGMDGMSVQNAGSGRVELSAADVTGANGAGIMVNNSVRPGTIVGVNIYTPAGTDIVISSTGHVSGSGNGIEAVNLGTGTVDISANRVTGNASYGAGIFAVNYGDSITINASGAVVGADTGINASNRGTGLLDINVADVTGNRRSGIVASNRNSGPGISYGSSISVTSSGSVFGVSRGIGVFDYGTDLTSIDLVNVSSSNDFGAVALEARAGAGGIEISISGEVSGSRGLSITNSGPGSTSIAVNNVTAFGETGIYASSNGGNIDINSTAGSVSGAFRGVMAVQNGSGDLLVTSATVTGVSGSGYGIVASVRDSANSNLIIDSTAGTISGGFRGILARNDGAGLIDITTADVVSAGRGIDAFSAGDGGTLTIDTKAGSISGKYIGIIANNRSGAVNITSADVSSAGGIGIYAKSNDGDIAIDTVSGAISGFDHGISAHTQPGSGKISITTADVTSTSDTPGSSAIEIAHGGSDIDVSSMGTVSGVDAGINIFDTGGTGDISINVNEVIGQNANAISVGDRNMPLRGGLSINVTRQITAGVFGIYGKAFGDVDIQVTDITSGSSSGISIEAEGAKLNVASTGTIDGGFNGISTRNAGTGATTISAVTTIGAQDAGIKAFNSAGSSDLTIQSTGSTSGSRYGIVSSNGGTGANTITAVDSSGASVDGIFGFNGETANGLTITSTGDASGGRNGITASSRGYGATYVNSQNSGGRNGAGIAVFNGVNSGNVFVDSRGSATGTNSGIFAGNDGAGMISIKANVAIGGFYGIQTRAATGITDIILASGAAISSTDGAGIFATSTGEAADINVNSLNGIIVGGTDGINLTSMGGSISIIDIDNVTGRGGNGITAMSNGGSINITGIVDILGIGGSGIFAEAGSGGINIDVGSVSGDDIGIYAFRSGDGSAAAPTSSPTAAAVGFETVSEQFGTGVDATSAMQGSGDNQILLTSENSFTNEALLSQSLGLAAVGQSQAASGSTSGALKRSDMIAENGAFASNGLNPSDLDNEAQRGADMFAEEAPHDEAPMLADKTDQGSGNNALTLTGRSNPGDGLEAVVLNGGETPKQDAEPDDGRKELWADAQTEDALNEAVSGSSGLSITATGDITAGNSGIVAINNGAGDTSIHTLSDLTGTTGIGIMVTGGANGDAVSITTGGTVTGGTTGIFADARKGVLALNIGGDVTGGENGVVTVTQGGTNFTVAADQTISGGNVGIATMATDGSATSNDVLDILGTVNGVIMTFEGDDILTIAEGGNVNGNIMLGAGNDALNWNGSISGALRGGDDIDTLNFNTGAGLITNSGAENDGIAEFEIYNFNIGGFALAGTHQGLTETNFNVGDHILRGTLGATSVNIGNGVGLQVADGAIINGSLFHSGNLGLNAGGIANLTINGNFGQLADGVLTVDVVDGATFDSIIVSGNVTLDGALVIRQNQFVLDTTTLIDGGTGLAGNFSSVTGLSTGGLLISQSIELDQTSNDVNLVVIFASPGDIVGLNPGQAGVAGNIVSQLRNGNLTGGLKDLGLAISLISDGAALGNAIDELQPSIFNGGVEVFRNSQMLFMRSMLNQQVGNTGGGGAGVETGLLAAATASAQASDGPNMWGSIQYTDYEQGRGLTNRSYDTDGYELIAGVSNIRFRDFTFGVAVGFAELESIDDGIGRDQMQTDLFRVGISAGVELNNSGGGLRGRLDTAAGLAFGSNDVVMNINLPGLGVNTVQSGSADLDNFNIVGKLTIDGVGDKTWPVKPHLLLAYDHSSQKSIMFGNRQATGLAINGADFDRFTFGYGLTLDRQIGDATTFRLTASGMHHSSDTRSILVSRFLSTATASPTFNVAGISVRDQYLGEIGLGHHFGDGWSMSVDGFVEFGDIEGFGGQLKLNKRF